MRKLIFILLISVVVFSCNKDTQPITQQQIEKVQIRVREVNNGITVGYSPVTQVVLSH